MAEDNANRNWQEWLVEQGLQGTQADTGAQQGQTAATQPIQYAQPEAAQAASAYAQAGHAQQAAAATQPMPQTAEGAGRSAYGQQVAATQPQYAPQQAQAAQQATVRQAAAAQQPVAAAATTQQAAAQPTYAAAGQQSASAQQQYGAAAHATTDTKAARKAAKKQAKAAKSSKSGGGFKTFGLGFLGAACAFALGAGILAGTGAFDRQSTVVESVSDAGTVVLGSETNTAVQAVDNHTESLAEAVADKVLPSVVGIDVYANYSSAYSFWGSGSTDSETLSGLGSGVVISKDGYILTNYHVVEGATKLMVTANGEELEATVVGTDESSDLAVIKVEADDLVPVEIGSSENLKPGQWVMTVGSPFGLEQSVATGIISATSRTVVIESDYSYYSYSQQVQPSVYSNMIQTDAAINPGNSGGALVDENGKLIGINSVIESYSGSYSGVGFAIPVDYAMNIATQIIDGKTPTHAQIGVSATTVDRDIAERYDLGAVAGAYINKVYDDSGAQAAGLEQGDIITKLAGVAVESSTDLVAQVRAHNPGDTVTVEFVRGTETMEVEVTLGSDEETLATQQEQQQQQQGGTYHNWGYGDEGNGNDGFGFDFGEGDDNQGFSYEDLEELFNYLNR